MVRVDDRAIFWDLGATWAQPGSCVGHRPLPDEYVTGAYQNATAALLSGPEHSKALPSGPVSQPLRLEPVGILRTVSAPLPDGHRHLAAASGLVVTGGRAYVVADDTRYLGVFDPSFDGDGALHPLLDTPLPADPVARKRIKPDFEALAHAPGALLAIGSGSKPTRERAIVVPLAEDGTLGEPRVISLSALYARLRPHFTELNIEGAAVRGDELLLFQRGNGTGNQSALITVDLAEFLAGDAQTPAIKKIDLGQMGGVPLAFTDASVLPDGRIAFVAAAEDTENTYADGEIVGSAFGVLSAAGDLRVLRPLDRKIKVEGVFAEICDGAISATLVTDADDPAQPARAFRITLP